VIADPSPAPDGGDNESDPPPEDDESDEPTNDEGDLVRFLPARKQFTFILLTAYVNTHNLKILKSNP
jgi:hypothetical protein